MDKTSKVSKVESSCKVVGLKSHTGFRRPGPALRLLFIFEKWKMKLWLRSNPNKIPTIEEKNNGGYSIK